MTRVEALKHNSKQFLVSLDQAIGCLVAVIVTLLSFICPSTPYWLAWADETLSALSWRWHVAGVRSWPCRLIDIGALLFRDKNHCQVSYENEVKRQHSPPECRV